MVLRLQASALLLLFLIASVLGQVGLRQCLCSGEISFSFEAPEENCGLHEAKVEEPLCSHCAPASSEHEEPPLSPCERGDCFVLLAVQALDSKVILDLRPPAPLAGPAFTPLAPPVLSGSPEALLAPLSLRPPAPPTVPLTVLYGAFLI
jgi:hypothetical protein